MEGAVVTDDMMPMTEARERAAAMLEEQCNLVLRWAEGAVPEIAAEYGIDEAAASHTERAARARARRSARGTWLCTVSLDGEPWRGRH